VLFKNKKLDHKIKDPLPKILVKSIYILVIMKIQDKKLINMMMDLSTFKTKRLRLKV
jgi:hypothetical protein